MDEKELAAKLDFYDKVGAFPVILYYGDTIWKRTWLGYKRIMNPSGKLYGSEAPRHKAKIGSYVTRMTGGQINPGIGVVAANLMEVDGDKIEGLKLIFKADKHVEGIAIINDKNDVLDWISREDVSKIQ